MNKQDLNNYIKKVVNFSFDANKYFNDSKPWSLKNTDTNRMETILFTIIEQIKNISILLYPIMPISTSVILDTINLPKDERNLDNIKKINSLDHNKDLKKISILFKKVENDN